MCSVLVDAAHASGAPAAHMQWVSTHAQCTNPNPNPNPIYCAPVAPEVCGHMLCIHCVSTRSDPALTHCAASTNTLCICPALATQRGAGQAAAGAHEGAMHAPRLLWLVPLVYLRAVLSDSYPALVH
eukprot:scaffold67908_cov104-Phaeocystis_antarctica.AAC.2